VEEKKKELSPELQEELDELFEELSEETSDPKESKKLQEELKKWGQLFQEAKDANKNSASNEKMAELEKQIIKNMPQELKNMVANDSGYEQELLNELARASEGEDERIIKEVNLQISHLPDSLQASFVALNISPLKLFVALRGIALLAFRYQRHCGCKKGLIYLEECGNISFENHKSFIPATRTIHEMYSYAGVKKNTATKLLTWTCEAAMYWPKIIPELKVKAVHITGDKLRITLEEDKK